MEDIFDTTFYDWSQNNLFEYLDKVIVWLGDNDEEFIDYSKEEEQLLNKYSKLRKVLDDREQIKLSKEEVKIAIKVIDIRESKQIIINEKIFFKGMNEAIGLLKKTGLLKEIEKHDTE